MAVFSGQVELSYTASVQALDQARVAFREVNRKIRAAAFEVSVAFMDEHE